MRQASRSIWIALLAMLLAQPAAAQTAEANERVFDRASSLVQRRYFDPELKGLDWEEAAELTLAAALDCIQSHLGL